MRSPAVLAASLIASLAALTGSSARADVQHTIARGHTLEAIAHRYHVTTDAIIAANHLKDPRHLKVGDTLTIPGVQATSSGGSGANGANTKKGPDGKPVKPVVYATRAKTPDVVHVTRLATNEGYTLHVNARRGKISPTVAKQAEQMMRSMGGLTHPIEPRLLHLLAAVSNHFGSRKIEIISGFRPFSELQHTAHSHHNIGKAVDFRVVGVPNEVVRDFCRTLREVGCGYYPNSTFVHMDAREGASAFWIDYSRPGEPPRYNAPNLDADEGTSDVGEAAHLAPADEGDDESAPPPVVAPVNPGSAPAPSPAPAAPSAPPSVPAPAPTPVAPPVPSPGPAAALGNGRAGLAPGDSATPR